MLLKLFPDPLLRKTILNKRKSFIIMIFDNFDKKIPIARDLNLSNCIVLNQIDI